VFPIKVVVQSGKSPVTSTVMVAQVHALTITGKVQKCKTNKKVNWVKIILVEFEQTLKRILSPTLDPD